MICGIDVQFHSVTSSHPEAPEMFCTASAGRWIGLMEDRSGGPGLVFVACSEKCLGQLLEE
jgi:hypothetical protein